MDLYQEIAGRRCITRDDFKNLTGTDSAADWHIRTFLEKGYIERVRHDLYAVISLETGQPIANRFQIVSAAAEDACVSHHSAFEYYGVANQVFYEVYFTSQKRLHDFYYDGYDYHCLPSRGTVGVVEDPTGVRVTSLERTVIDSIADFEKIGGLEELLRCLILVPTLVPDKLLEALELFSKTSGSQRASLRPVKHVLLTARDISQRTIGKITSCINAGSSMRQLIRRRS